MQTGRTSVLEATAGIAFCFMPKVTGPPRLITGVKSYASTSLSIRWRLVAITIALVAFPGFEIRGLAMD